MASFHTSSITSGLPYFRTILAPFFPEVPEGNLLLLALSPTQIFQFFSFGCGKDAGRNVRRKNGVWLEFL